MFKPKLTIPKKEEQDKDERFSQLPPLQICYASQQKTPIPLKHVDLNLHVQMGFVRVEVVQSYSTEKFKNPVDIEYLFVINKNATVTKMIVEIDDEKRHGIIKEKQEARIEYEEGIKQGKTMAYSEQDQDTPQVKKVKIGALAPKKKLIIRFEYVQPLEVFLNKYWKIEVSPLISPCYLEESLKISSQQVSEDLRKIVGNLNNQLKHRQNIQIDINLETQITIFKSPTHQLKQIRLTGKKVNQNKLSLELIDTPENFLPNKQFILMFASNEINLPRAILTHTLRDELQSQKYCATLTFIPKFNEVSFDDAYQQYLDGLNIVPQQKINKAVYLFFLDRSGSMSGSRIEKAKQALILFLKSLPENCSFNIISFGGNHKTMWSNPLRYTQRNLEKAIEIVEDMQADFGGTEIFTPLNEVVFKNKKNSSKTKQLVSQNIFLLTDGEVVAEPILRLIQENQSAEIRFYSLGIGQGCSQYLIKRTAEVGNGKFHIMDDNEDINDKVIDLLEDSLTSYLKAFNLETNANKIQQIIPAPDSIVCLKKNQELMIQVIFSAEQSNNNIEFNLSCYDPQAQKPIKYNIQLNLEKSQENEYFHKIAAYKFINIVEESIKNNDQEVKQLDFKKKSLTEKEIIELSIQYQILCNKTAFVCEICNLEDQFYQQARQKITVNKFVKIQQKNIQPKNHYRGRTKQTARKSTAGAVQTSGGKGACKGVCSPHRFCPGLVILKPQYSAGSLEKVDQVSRSNSVDSQRSRSGSLERYGKKKGVREKKKSQLQKSKKLNASQTQNIQSKKRSSSLQSRSKSQKKMQIEEEGKQFVSYTKLIQSAEAEGSFNLTTDLCKALKTRQFQNKKKLGLKLWQTLLTLFYLELFCSQQNRSWQLVFGKGINYLSKNGINYNSEKLELQSKYKDFIKE